MEPFLAEVRNGALRHALSYGVGFLYDTMTPAEQAAVITLFDSGAIQV